MLGPIRVRSALVLASLAAVLTGVAALGIAGVAAAAQQRAAGQQIDHRVSLVGAATSGQLNRYVAALSMVAAGLGAAQPLTADTFMRATAPLQGLGLSGVPAIGFVVPAHDDQITAVQARWRARGSNGLILVPNRDVDDHLFTVLNRSIDGSDPPVPGGDSTQAPAAAAAMIQARTSGQVTVSDAFPLLRDRVLPATQRQLSFAIAAPVWGAEPPTGQRFVGWAVISLRGQDFITATLRAVAQDLVDVTLLARAAGSAPVTVASLRASGSGRRDLHRTRDLLVAQAHWTLRVDAVAARLPGGRSVVPQATGVVGLLIAVLAAVLITGRVRADTQVRTATAELVDSTRHLNDELAARSTAEALLRAAHDDLAAERTRLTQVLDALEVSVVTCDLDGTIGHLNRTARDRLGAGPQPSTIADYRARLNFTNPDGTALPESSLSLSRSLHGEIVDGLEVAAVSPADGSRWILRLHSRPLRDPNGGIVGAVASSYDITALREHQAELTAFAGIVAHDLKAPLTAISGFTRLALTALAANAPHDKPAGQLQQVLDATHRMDRLIDEVLGYAAARDAHLHRTDIDLRALTDQAVTDQLTACAAQPDAPVPQVFIGALPPIHADASMMRQLLDNLIGNCLKYSPPGQPARIDITGETTDTGETRLTIADRGIGIPQDQHQAVFDSFQRADHADVYPGTGLGLSICQRIAQRHGGYITAADNPGGGTRITVTLPAGGQCKPVTAHRSASPRLPHTPTPHDGSTG